MGVFSILGLILLTFIAFLVIKFYIQTRIRMNRYIKQGFIEYCYFPFFGIIIEWMNTKSKDCMDQLKKLSNDDKFKNADGILTNLKDQPFIILINPNLINQFLQNQQHYIKFEEHIIGFKQLFGNGVVFAEGEEWKKKRKFISNMFKFDAITYYLDNIRFISRKMLERINEKEFNAQVGFSDITGAISLSLFLGSDIDKYNMNGQNPAHAIDTFISEIFQHYIHPYAAILGQKVVKMNLRESDKKINQKCKLVRDFMRNILKDSIKREKQQLKDKQKYHNLISLILDEGQQLESEQEIEDLLDIAFNIYFAAKDTSTTTLSVFLYYLLSHPQHYKRVEEEVMNLPKEYTLNDVQQLNFLQACIKESLRVTATANVVFTRVCNSDHQLGKYKITKGTFVTASIITNQLDSQYFENPLTYDPDRWFKESTKKVISQNPCVYLPFSSGMRNCIGQHLANLQMKIIIIELIRKYQQPKIPKDYILEMSVLQSYTVKNPLILELIQRKQV